MGIRTGGKRGAPAGNRNRLKHGHYSARRIARRAEVNALLRKVRNLTRRIEMMGWARKALRAKRLAEACAAKDFGRVPAHVYSRRHLALASPDTPHAQIPSR